MKKRLLVLTLIISVIVLGILVSCNNNVPAEINKESNITSLSEKDELVLYSLLQNYKIPEETVKSDLKAFLSNNQEDNSSGLVKTVNKVSNVKLEKNSTYTIPVSNYNINKVEKSIDADANENINLYLYNTTTNDSKGYAIVSDDLRIGEILCIVDGEFESDISNDEFMKRYVNALENHIDKTIDMWNSISEKDIEEVKNKLGITDEDIEKARNNGITPKKFWGWSYGEWKTKYVDCNLNTSWSEEAPYNKVAGDIVGYNFLLGTSNVALSQLMAYHSFPEKCDDNIKNVVTNKYDLLKNWDGKFNWSEMKKENITDCDEETKLMVGTLLYQNKAKLNENILASDDRISINQVSTLLSEYGYWHNGIENYDFDTVYTSISCKRLF